MKYYSFCPFIMAFVFSTLCFGQNLVPNPSFEDYLECPYSTAEFQTQVVDWFSWQETPDYFNICSNDLDGFAGVPENVLGFQYPLTGDAYAALYTYAYFAPNVREYIATQLIEPLIVGEEYYVSFFTSMYDGGVEVESWCATNHIGLRFFKDPAYDSDINILEPDNFVHIDYSEILTDTTNWTHVEGYFTADQTYNWLALGNFFDAENTEIQVLNDEDRCFGIYYIENICVATNAADCDYLLSTIESENKVQISIFPNPSTGRVFITNQKYKFDHIELLDITGKKISEWNPHKSKSAEIDISNFHNGLYFLTIHTANAIFKQKIIKQ